jgi:hypothetical protein
MAPLLGQGTISQVYAPLATDFQDCAANKRQGAIDIDIYDGSTWLTTLWANSYRPDLVSAGKGNGFHGYGFQPPTPWLP